MRVRMMVWLISGSASSAAWRAAAPAKAATPGTIWVDYDSRSNTVLLHILDLVDEEQWVRTIKDRYERRLMEVFE